MGTLVPEETYENATITELEIQVISKSYKNSSWKTLYLVERFWVRKFLM
jgi:hypothetical protein